MTEPHWSKRVLVVGVDFSELGDAALREACAISDLRADSEVHAVHAVPMNAMMATDDSLIAEQPDVDSLVTSLKEHVAVHAKVHADRTPARLFTHVRVGAAASEIVALAAELGAELIVVGTHGRRGLARLALGSVAEHVLRRATCPVLVLSPKGHAEE
jgi:nucleotide-binding universal stress UspA family protein